MMKTLVTKRNLSALILVTLLTASASSVGAQDPKYDQYDNYYGNGYWTSSNPGSAITSSGTTSGNLTIGSITIADPATPTAKPINYTGIAVKADASDSVTYTVDGDYKATIINNTAPSQAPTDPEEESKTPITRGVYVVGHDNGNPDTTDDKQSIFNVNKNFSTEITSQGRAIGLHVDQQGVANLNTSIVNDPNIINNNINVTGSGRDVFGIYAEGDIDKASGGGEITVNGNTDIEVHNKGPGAEILNPGLNEWALMNTKTQGIGSYHAGNTTFKGTVDVNVTGSDTTYYVDGINHTGFYGTMLFEKDVTINSTIDVPAPGQEWAHFVRGVYLGREWGTYSGNFTEKELVTTFEGILNITASCDAEKVGAIGIFSEGVIGVGTNGPQIGNFENEVHITSTQVGIMNFYGTLNFKGDVEINADKYSNGSGVSVGKRSDPNEYEGEDWKKNCMVTFENGLTIAPLVTSKWVRFTALKTTNENGYGTDDNTDDGGGRGIIKVNTSKKGVVQIDGDILADYDGEITAYLRTADSHIIGDYNGPLVKTTF